MKTHLEVLHETEGWRTACGSHTQRTTSHHDNVDCLQCRCTDAFKASQQPSDGAEECTE